MGSAAAMVLLVVVVASGGDAEPNVVRDFCEKDIFRTKCSEEDEVAVIQHASYGRMKVGTCLSAGYGSLGCSVDILPHLDQLCSGRATCSLNVRDLLTFNPCPEDLRGYLEVMYTCIRVHNPAYASKDKSACFSDKSLATEIVANRTKDTASHFSNGVKWTFMYSGVISNYVTEVTNCGGLDHPWTIRAQPGQRLNMTIVDFSGLGATLGNGNDKSWKSSGLCQVYANILDKTVGTTETICADEPRVRHAYLSVSHHVEIRSMVRSNKAEPAIYALLYYHVVECPDVLDVPSGGKRWFKKLSKERAIFGCVETREVYELTCAVNEWKGSDVNCSFGGFAFTSGFLSGKHLSVEDKIVLTIIVMCLIGGIVLAGGIVIVKRKMADRLRQSELRLAQEEILRQQQFRQHQQHQQQHHQQQHQQLIYAQKVQAYSAGPLIGIKSPLALQAGQGLPQAYAFGHEALDCCFRQPGVPASSSSRGSKSHAMSSQGSLVAADDSSSSYNKLISDHIYESPKSIRREVERLIGGEREQKQQPSLPLQMQIASQVVSSAT